jgi:hypothetical protein
VKVYVIPAGEGLALPLPANLAAALGLRVGAAVEIHGPGPDGSLRYVPVAVQAPVAGSPSRAGPRKEPVATPDPAPAPDLTPADVAEAVSSPPRGMSVPPPPAREARSGDSDEFRSDAPAPGEISQLIALHADSLREVCA